MTIPEAVRAEAVEAALKIFETADGRSNVVDVVIEVLERHYATRIDRLEALLRRWRDDYDAYPSDPGLDEETIAAIGSRAEYPTAESMAELPPHLMAVLRDQSVIVSQDAGVFEKIAEWNNAPPGTASTRPAADPKP